MKLNSAMRAATASADFNAVSWQVLVGDVREQLALLSDASVQCCVTSPPYWGLRDYGVIGQIGMNTTPEEYVIELVDVFEDVKRVLVDDGVLWLNLGDSYQNAKGQAGGVDPKQPARRPGLRPQDGAVPGLKPKDIVGIPWMVAFALRAAGWYLRSDVIWSKPNPMPESVTDRPTKAHEYIFLLTKSKRYYYDAKAIAEPSTGQNGAAANFARATTKERLIPGQNTIQHRIDRTPTTNNGSRNARSVWSIATQPYPGAHFATFPEAIPERCIKAGSRTGDIVLDPFCGSGTTGQVAIRLGRSFIGVELNADYAELARKRIVQIKPARRAGKRVAVVLSAVPRVACMDDPFADVR